MSSMRSNYDVFVPLRLPALVSSRSIAQSETWAVNQSHSNGMEGIGSFADFVILYWKK